MLTALLDFDRQYTEQGYASICGVDEAGRGPLAGPVYAAAVILPPEPRLTGLRDSKKLTAKSRDRLYDEILEQAVAWSIAVVSAEEIDEWNILQATLLAMRRAVAGLSLAPAIALVDGNADPGLGIPTQTVIKGDDTSACIAAASILAKVSRDRHMLALDEAYPEYGFAKHKGYGTRQHYAVLDSIGPCPEHRRSFLKKWEAARHANG